MALSANTGFFFRKSLNGLEHPATLNFIIEASATVRIGDMVRVDTNGYLKRCATGEIPAGVLVDIVDLNDQNVFSPRASGTAGATLTPGDTVTVSSTNASDATRNIQGKVIMDPAGNCLFYNLADSAMTVSNLFQTFDVANSNQVTVGGASDTTSKEVMLVSLDPDGDGNTSKGLFRIHNNQFGVGVDKGDTRVAA